MSEKSTSRRARRQLAGKHVVITGASSGIGRAAARAVAAKGAVVLLLARRPDELAAAVEEITAAGGRAYAYRCDVTDAESVEQTVAAILAEHDHVDMLVNNAGRSIRRAVHRSTDRMHDFERTMAVNYFGAVRMTLALLPHMRSRGGGHVVNISSAGVQAATPRFAAYLASKAALDMFTDVTAAEMLAAGVTFTTVHMPLVRTPMIAPTGRQGPTKSPEWAAAIVVRALTRRPKRIDTPLGTLADYGSMFTPRIKDAIMHRYYRMLPDSPAAKGELAVSDSEGTPEVTTAGGSAAATVETTQQPAPQRTSRRRFRSTRVTRSTLTVLAAVVPGANW
ncbi:SDR family NAD(P)-dependent oxidoreductase [Nocardia stercoris]|uniref:SDR family NAD(P)-dependent oxidoreductase n=1 Tax=Nocardia stercoris TaxID=2483361 RepID=A0A3M2L254_9NOCA|nr:SDR family NAD(P)-dependent oxidoreductase [Nocardia stercoris]RMI31782.1 SDR family NAD(P)-dependent oxidoreductase [Nocardia stercoris]